MSARITAAERAAIARYTGPLRRIPAGQSGLPRYFWNGWRLARTSDQIPAVARSVAAYATLNHGRGWTIRTFAHWAGLAQSTALYRVTIALAHGLIRANARHFTAAPDLVPHSNEGSRS